MRWALLVVVGCSSPAATVDAADPACATVATQVTTHPHAVEQRTAIGRDLADTRGWHGRLYFGYGDLGENTGPIEISSYDPVAGTWADHVLLETERIIRYFPIGDTLYAPSGDPRNGPGKPAVAYATGTADHVWTTAELPSGFHFTAAVERAPGDVFLTGEDLLPGSTTITSGAAWRAQNGGAFTETFPIDVGNSQPEVWFFNAAALAGTLYVGFGWTFDGTQWAHPAVDLGEFQRPVTFANAIVSVTLGELWAYDGMHMRNLRFDLFTGTGIEQTTVQPLPLFTATEDHLVAIDTTGTVRATTDLETWSCVGQAPADVRSIGSLGGTVYLGGADGRVYAYPASW